MMNILKKSIAPITDDAWQEISDQADRFKKIYLTGRKFVDINGPNGLEMGGLSTGRLIVPESNSNEGVNYGIREIIPLMELRSPFELDLWELDNIDRGAKDIDLDPLEKALKQIALFEETAIYNGFEKASIKGLEGSAENPGVNLSSDPELFLNTINGEILSMQKDGVEGPYCLILTENLWQSINTLKKGYPVVNQIKELIQGKVIINHYNDNSYLVSERGEDYELAIGQDITIGYNGHTTEKVKLYLTESFTFRVLSPEAIRVLTTKKN
jgi:uncharacterized linocin/CFP29 family protein